jgi:hypothetical protein
VGLVVVFVGSIVVTELVAREWRVLQDREVPELKPWERAPVGGYYELITTGWPQIPPAIRLHVVRPKRVPEEAEVLLPGIPDRGLRLVERKSEFRHYAPCPCQCLFRMAAAEDGKVVGVRDDMRSVACRSVRFAAGTSGSDPCRC